MAEIITYRRYIASKVRKYTKTHPPMAKAFKDKYLAIPADLLPLDFPGYDLLVNEQPIPYLAYQDLSGADKEELLNISGITPSLADDIITAVDAWLLEQD